MHWSIFHCSTVGTSTAVRVRFHLFVYLVSNQYLDEMLQSALLALES